MASGSYRGAAEARPLPYERWALRFEEIVVSDLLVHPLGVGDEAITAAGVLEEAEELLLFHLTVGFLFEGEPDVIGNPPVPAAVAHVYAQQQAATSLLGNLFRALFNPEASASVYTTVGYDGDGEACLLAQFAIAILAGVPSFEQRRVLYEGEWLLEELVADSPAGLRELHGCLYSAFESFRTAGSP